MPPTTPEAIARIFLEPSLFEGGLYWCDDNISGHLQLTIDTVFYTRSICVILEAVQSISVSKDKSKSQSSSSEGSEPTVYRSQLFEKKILLVGDEWSQREKSRVVQLDRGVHRLKFAFGEQLEKMPSSMNKKVRADGLEAEVVCQWRVRGLIDVVDEEPLLIQHPLEVGGYQFDPLLAIPATPDLPSIFKRSTTISYAVMPGNVTVRASANREAYHPGDNILLHLQITSSIRQRIIGVQMDVRNFVKIEQPGVPMTSFETIGVGTDESAVCEAGGTLERTWPVEIPRNGWPTVILDKASAGVYLDISLIVEGMVAGDSTLRLPFLVLLSKPPARVEFKSPVDPTPNPKSIPWMLDDETDVCCVCSNKFGPWTRRHHCRNCGVVVCSSCSPKIAIADSFGPKPQRICVTCYPRRK